MKPITCLFLALFGLTLTTFAEDCQSLTTRLGDLCALTLGGVTLTQTTTIDLDPLCEAEATNGFYGVECRVIYKNRTIERPETEIEFGLVQRTSELLNGWLADFVRAEYTLVPLADLIELYASGQIVASLDQQFPLYVAQRIAELPRSEVLRVESVLVECRAIGALKKALEARNARLSR